MTSGAGNRRKGHQFERDIATELRAIGFTGAERELDTGKGDIQGVPGLHIECKNLQSFAEAVNVGLLQGELQAEGKPFIIIAKRRGKHAREAVVCVPLRKLPLLLHWAASRNQAYIPYRREKGALL